ncbi:MAG: alpha-glucosidase [Spirochaetia bacterium]|nr:alpha-glucosidase [Spirochaetia bacterium]
MLRAQKKNLKIIFDPPTGNFKTSLGPLDLEGTIQTGHYASPLFLVRLGMDDTIYGLGAATSKPNRNNQRFRLFNYDTLFYTIKESSYTSFPFFLIRRQNSFIGVYLNTTLPAQVTTGNSDNDPSGPCIRFDLQSGGHPMPIDVFAFQGTIPEILKQYSQICGRPFLPPAWALGFQQSRWSYRSADRVLELADRFRREEVPCDAIHLDIHYMDKYKVFTWDPKHFQDPAGLHQKLEELGMRTVGIVDPGVATVEGYAPYEDGLQKDYFCKKSDGTPYVGRVWPGATTFPDFTREEVRKWWGHHHKPIFDAGVSGIWNDMNDPVLKMGKNYDPLKEDITHKGGSHREVRNVYANYEAEGTWKGFEEHLPDRRPFIVTRSGFCGIQRYSAVWTGDNRSNWKHMKANLHMVINLGLTGVPFSGADVGGFGSGTDIPGLYQWAAFKFRKDKELFSRWLELGSLMPFFRAHTTLYSYDQEPWSFGDEVLAIAKKHIRRRYRLLPYIYALAHRAHVTGEPMVRPLFYEFPELPEGHGADQFMLGSSLLAAPVLEPRAGTRRVILPPGDWYEFESCKKYTGGREEIIDVGPGFYPLFVRAGTVLPVCAGGRNVIESLRSPLALEVYPGPQLSGRLVLDDGLTLAADRGEIFDLEISGKEDRTGNIALELAVLKRKFSPEQKQISIRLPVNYRMMEGRGRRQEGVGVNLSREDRRFTMYSYDVSLQNQKLEFPYRSSWNG